MEHVFSIEEDIFSVNAENRLGSYYIFKFNSPQPTYYDIKGALIDMHHMLSEVDRMFSYEFVTDCKFEIEPGFQKLVINIHNTDMNDERIVFSSFEPAPFFFYDDDLSVFNSGLEYLERAGKIIETLIRLIDKE